VRRPALGIAFNCIPYGGEGVNCDLNTTYTTHFIQEVAIDVHCVMCKRIVFIYIYIYISMVWAEYLVPSR